MADDDAAGFIDSTSLYQVVISLSYDSPCNAAVSGWSPWDTHVPMLVTALLLSTSHMRCIVPPKEVMYPTETFGCLVGQLDDAGLVERPAGSKEQVANVAKVTSRWADRNVQKIRSVLSETLQDTAKYDRWIRGNVSLVWAEHARRLNGLYEDTPQAISLLARVTGHSKADLNSALTMSRNESLLLKYRDIARSGGLPAIDEFMVLRDAYTSSVIMRGRYYDDLIIGVGGGQLNQHPIRHPSLLRPSSPTVLGFSDPRSTTLAALILNSCYSERKHVDRIRYWVQAIKNAKEHHVADEMPSGIPDNYGSNDWKHLAMLLRHADIRLHSEWKESLVDYSAAFSGALAPGIPSAILLTGVVPQLVAVLIQALGATAAVRLFRDQRVGRRTLDRISLTESRLRDLSSFPPGRISSSVTPPS